MIQPIVNRHPSRGPLAALAFVVAAACSAPAPRENLQDRIERQLQPWRELQQQKADLWYEGQRPEDFVFADHGTVHVKRWELQGWPGEEYVNVRFTYENTTEQPVVHAFVWLEIFDGDGAVWGSSGVRVFNPFGYALWPGDTVTQELRAPTNGSHKKDGWGYGIACSALPDDNPGERPRLIVPQIPRGWQYTPAPSEVRRSRMVFDRPGITSW